MLSSRHMNLCLFFEGTGQDGDERITNVTRLHDACENSGRQRLNLQPGPGTHFGAYLRGLVHGHDWRIAFRRARRWFETCSRHSPRGGRPPRVFLFGFSRGALIARHFASWLDKLDVKVDYLGLWDTVDATAGLDVEETPPPNVLHARHAVAENETRRLYGYVPLRAGGRTPEGVRIEELVFPGSHSDVGGLFDDNHVVADASLAWIAQGAAEAGILLSDPSILTPPPGNAEIILHDQSGEATNLWGILGEAKRKLKGIPRHFLCRGKREP